MKKSFTPSLRLILKTSIRESNLCHPKDRSSIYVQRQDWDINAICSICCQRIISIVLWTVATVARIRKSAAINKRNLLQTNSHCTIAVMLDRANMSRCVTCRCFFSPKSIKVHKILHFTLTGWVGDLSANDHSRFSESHHSGAARHSRVYSNEAKNEPGTVFITLCIFSAYRFRFFIALLSLPHHHIGNPSRFN